MNPLGILIAGLIGTLAMSVAMAVEPRMGLPQFDAIGWLSAAITARPIRVVGFILHLIVGVLWMLVYAAVWSAGITAPGVSLGIVAGIIHWLIAGVLVGVVVPLFAGVQSGAIKAPGMYMRELGSMGFIAGLMPHIIYGMTVGLVYQFFV